MVDPTLVPSLPSTLAESASAYTTVPAPGLGFLLEPTHVFLLPPIEYELLWEEESMPELPQWFRRFLNMPVPPWFQTPAHAFEFTTKGQFTKARVGEVGEMLGHCEN